MRPATRKASRISVSNIRSGSTRRARMTGLAPSPTAYRVRGRRATAARWRYAFIGDSANDAAAFAAFGVTFGVENVRAHLRGLTVPPRYIGPSPMGCGFAAIAAKLGEMRRSGGEALLPCTTSGR